MGSEAILEAQRRKQLADKVAARYKDRSLGVILVGSVAHSPDRVTHTSDVDILVVTKNIKDIVDDAIRDKNLVERLRKRFFDGYCLKEEVDGAPVSIHFLSDDAFEIISRCFVADVRVYRPEEKTGKYNLRNFEGIVYPYDIKNIPLKELTGVRTIVPISFISNDRYFIGIHRDKLLSRPAILYEQKGYVATKVEKLWEIVVENLCDEGSRLYDVVDLSRMSILNALEKKDTMNEDAKGEIQDKSLFYLRRICPTEKLIVTSN